MAGYEYKVVSFDGDTAIADGAADYRAYFASADGNPLGTFQMTPIVAEIARSHPATQGAQPQGKVIPMTIELRDTDHAKLNTLKKKIGLRDGVEKYLVVTDGSGVSLRLACMPLGLVRESAAIFTLPLYVARPVLEKNTETDSTEANIATSPKTWNPTANGGNDIVEPRITFTPNAYKKASSSPRQMRFCRIAPRSPLKHVDRWGNGWPIDITGGGLDVETLVKGNVANIASSTNAAPIVVTTSAAHGYRDGDRVCISGHQVNTAANGEWVIAGVASTTFQLVGSTGNGVGGATGDARRATMHPQGYDVQVRVAGVAVERYLSNWGAGAGGGGSFGSGGDQILSHCNGLAARHASSFYLPGCSEREPNSIDEMWLRLKTIGAPTGNLQVEVREDNAGKPGTLVATSNNVAIGAGVVDAYPRWASFTFTPFTATPRKKYWFVLLPPTGTNNATNYVAAALTELGFYEGLVENSAHSTDGGTTWLVGQAMFGLGPHDLFGSFSTIDFRAFVTGNAKIWVAPKLNGAKKVTLAQAILDVSVSTTIIRLADFDGHARLPAKGAALLGDEVWIYDGKDGTDGLIGKKRAARGTVAATHAAGTSVYIVPLDVRLIYDHENAGGLLKPAYSPDGLAPVIDGVTSTNESLKKIGPFLSPGEETRPGSVYVELDQSVELYPGVSLDADAANDDIDITLKDAIPAGAYINRNLITESVPVGIRAAAGAVSVKETIPDALVLEHILRNGRGEIEVAATHRSSDTPTALTTKTITPSAVAYRHQMRVSHRVITGADASGGSDIAITASAPKAMTFTLENDGLLEALAFKIKESTGTPPTNNLSIDLYAVSEDDSLDTSIKLIPTQSVAPSETTASYATISKVLSTAVKLPAGRYGFAFTTAEATNGYSVQGSDGSVYSGGEARAGGQVTIEISADYDAESDGTTISEAGTTLTVDQNTPNKAFAMRFPLTSLPSGLTVNAAALRYKISSVYGTGTGPNHYGYGVDNGQSDPDAETDASTFRGNCDDGNNYGAQVWTSLGLMTAVLGGSAASDIQNAKAAVDRWAVGTRELSTSHGPGSIYALDHATEPEPKLVITYTPPSTAAYTTKLGQDIWFRVFGTPTQSDTPTGTGGTLDLDDITYLLDNVTPGTPYVSMDAAGVDVYLLNGELKNNTTGKSIDLVAALQAADTLDIDFAARTFTLNDDDLPDTSAPYVASGFNEDLPFTLEPGANQLQWTESGLQGTGISIRTRYRDPYQ